VNSTASQETCQWRTIDAADNDAADNDKELRSASRFADDDRSARIDRV
jgi:hypothetical protein